MGERVGGELSVTFLSPALRQGSRARPIYGEASLNSHNQDILHWLLHWVLLVSSHLKMFKNTRPLGLILFALKLYLALGSIKSCSVLTGKRAGRMRNLNSADSARERVRERDFNRIKRRRG